MDLLKLFAALLLTTGLTLADTYYIDSVEGRDSANGRTPAQAWKSLARAPFNPGDVVCLKTGSVFRESLRIEKGPLLVKSYSDGFTPIISGAETLSDWKSEPNGLWSTALDADRGKPPLWLCKDGVPVEFQLRKNRPDDLAEPGEWCWADGRLWLSGSPGKAEWSVNRLDSGLNLQGTSGVEVQDLVVERCLNGVVCGDEGRLTRVTSVKNAKNGFVIAGIGNRLDLVRAEKNGHRVYKGDRSAPKGQGFLIDGSDNVLSGVVSLDNQEDGIQFGPSAGSGNQIKLAHIKGNGENCIDVKSGDQEILGGSFESDTEDAIIVHKRPHRVIIDKAQIRSLGDGPAVSVFEKAVVSLTRCVIESDLSSAVHLDKTAGDKCEVIDNEFLGGGKRSGAIIHVLGGKSHRINGNAYPSGSPVEDVKVEITDQ